jgi:predicted DCC family thiol-disulfide oxidoreductase YuxK
MKLEARDVDTQASPVIVQGSNPRQCLVYFDGDCPLCAGEIRLLRWLDRRGHITFVDIAAPEFDPETAGLTMAELMASIRGRDAHGDLVDGVEVFRLLYSAVGLWWLMPLTRLPGLSHLLEWVYARFATHRLRLTGRCTPESCPPHPLSRPGSGPR